MDRVPVRFFSDANKMVSHPVTCDESESRRMRDGFKIRKAFQERGGFPRAKRRILNANAYEDAIRQARYRDKRERMI